MIPVRDTNILANLEADFLSPSCQGDKQIHSRRVVILQTSRDLLNLIRANPSVHGTVSQGWLHTVVKIVDEKLDRGREGILVP